MSRTVPRQKPGKSRQDYRTPPELLAAIEQEFHVEEGETGRALAHEFGVSPTTICTLGRKRWSYLNEVQR